MPVGEGAKRRTGFLVSVMMADPLAGASWEIQAGMVGGLKFQSWREAAASERHRWPLWLPVMLGAGAAFYFAAPSEPSPAMAVAALAIAFAAGIVAFFGHRLGMTLALIAALALGFSLAKFHEMEVAAPVLDRTLTLHLTG